MVSNTVIITHQNMYTIWRFLHVVEYYYILAAFSEEPEEEEEKDKKVSNEWWAEYISEESKRDLTLSGKLMLLAQVLKMCDSIGDKV